MNEVDAFRRPNGRIGIRNLLLVMAVTDAAAPVARRIAADIHGVTAIAPPYGRGQLGEDLEQSVRTFVGLGLNPNVYAVLVVSLESVAGVRVADSIARSGKPVEVLSIQAEHGTRQLRRKAERLFHVWRRDVRRLKREAASFGELSIGLECGGSDATSGLVSNPAIGLVTDRLIDAGGTAIFSEPVECLGGEAILQKRAVTPTVQRQILAVIKKYEDMALRAGVDLNKTNPAPDNIRGGLSSIEEKSLGSICKSGSRSISGILRYAESPKEAGLYLMDAPAPATENITALSAAGVHTILFGTGMVNTIGSPIAPTIKICGNPLSCAAMGAHIDVGISDVITAGAELEVAAERIYQALRRVVSGRLTKCERLGEMDVAISRIGPSI